MEIPTSGNWQTWAPREEIAPRFFRDPTTNSLVIACDDTAQWGAWQHCIDGIEGGHSYHFAAQFRAMNVAHPIRCVSAQLDWLDENGQRLRSPDFAAPCGELDGWSCLEYHATAPPEARRVRIDLAFGWCAGGEVRWNGVQWNPQSALVERIVRAATVYARPQSTLSAAHSVEEFCRCIQAAQLEKPDVICLPEGITLIGTGRSCVEVSEPLHGPTSARLGEVARRLQTYIVAGIYEREGAVVYNTAILLGRDGKLAGAYRKTHLPREEVEAGLSPGDEYPVFETDFGRLGILICWDLQFPEACRALALRGAEIILLPIWGGSEALAYARAIENCVYLVSSSYDMRSFILDPTGAVLAEATPNHPVAMSELHLNRAIIQPWVGDMKTRTWKERRPDLSLEMVDHHG